MIGAHNVFTFIKTNIFMELFSFLWRCQDKSITTLYNDYNVRFFDIRISLKKFKWFKSKYMWVPTHGLVKLKDKTFFDLETLFLYMKMYFPDA